MEMQETSNAVRDLLMAGWTYQGIAKKLDCTHTSVSNWFHQKTEPRYALGVKLLQLAKKSKEEVEDGKLRA